MSKTNCNIYNIEALYEEGMIYEVERKHDTKSDVTKTHMNRKTK